MDAAIVTTPVKELFGQTLRASFEDLDLADDGAVEYLSDLLARFALTEELHPLDVVGDRLVSIADRWREIQRSWQADGRHFEPERELTIQRGIGDSTLFMTGFFWERVKSHSLTRFNVRQGKRAYRFLAEYHRAHGAREAAVFLTLAVRFETFAAVLSYMRDVYLGAEFAAWPHKAFARIITE